MNCVKIFVKNEKFLSRLIRTGAGRGSKRACGLKTRLKNCTSVVRSAEQVRNSVTLRAPQPGASCAELFASTVCSKRTDTCRSTATSNAGGKSSHGWRGRGARAPRCEDIIACAFARAAPLLPGAPPPTADGCVTGSCTTNPESFRGGGPPWFFPVLNPTLPLCALLCAPDAALASKVVLSPMTRDLRVASVFLFPSLSRVSSQRTPFAADLSADAGIGLG